jgi:filamentous hemagglutinin family protein
MNIKNSLTCLKCFVKMVIFLAIFTNLPSVKAQLIPDNTLGTENSRVTPQGIRDLIEGGAIRGSNLFHSFVDFNVGSQQQVYFANPSGITNILTRVTGNNASNILGTLGVEGVANLFLINPNGIIFGATAQLNMGGSFIGSTATSIKMVDGSFYSAINPQAPPLLTINAPIGLQLGSNPGGIQVQGTGNSDIFPTSNPGLTVAPGNTLALVGGDITFTGGIVTVPSGRIEIGSVANGEVDLIPTPGGLVLGYSRVTEFGTMQLLERSSLFNPAVGDNPLSGIQVVGGNIILDGSQIAAVTPGNFNSGNITIYASKSFALGGLTQTFPFSSWVVNQVAQGATGNGGAIAVTTPQLRIIDGARIQSLSQGFGAAGNVTVSASAIQISGFAPLPSNLPAGNPARELLEVSLNSRIGSETFASGAGGEVSVTTSELTLTDGGQISTLAGAIATGQGGNVTVNANTLTAVGSYPFNPLVITGIASYALGEGAGGDISVSAARITLLDGGEIFSWNPGSGLGGDVTVNASESIFGKGVDPLAPVVGSGIFASAIGAGDGGNIHVSTPQLTLSEGARISSFVVTQTPGGIPVPNVGTGNGGDVTVNADRIELIGTSPLAPDSLTQVGSITFGSGKAGDVTVSTRQLVVRDGAALTSSVIPSLSALGQPLPGSGTGNGGNLEVNASESIEIVGVNPFIVAPSFMGVQTFALGNAGELLVNTNRLVLRDGGSVSTFTSATGNAGQMTVNASEILISGKGANNFPSILGADAFQADESLQRAFFIPPVPSGNTGKITINTERLTVRDQGAINVRHEGTGNAGTLEVNASEVLLDRGTILATTASGNGGNVNLNVKDLLLLRNSSLITTTAGTAQQPGDGGNMEINAGFVVAVPQENSDIIANAFRGNGGKIAIATNEILGLEFRNQLTPLSDITAFTASPQLGFRQGEFQLTRFIPGVVDQVSKLPEQNFTDPSNQIVAGCPADRSNTFTVTGRGGIPDNPSQYLRGRAVWQDTRNLPQANRPTLPTINQQPSTSNNQPLIEAQGWIIDEDGTVILTDEPNTGKQPNSRVSSQWCQ